jgi:hypothetical protein
MSGGGRRPPATMWQTSIGATTCWLGIPSMLAVSLGGWVGLLGCGGLVGSGGGVERGGGLGRVLVRGGGGGVGGRRDCSGVLAEADAEAEAVTGTDAGRVVGEDKPAATGPGAGARVPWTTSAATATAISSTTVVTAKYHARGVIVRAIVRSARCSPGQGETGVART